MRDLNKLGTDLHQAIIDQNIQGVKDIMQQSGDELAQLLQMRKNGQNAFHKAVRNNNSEIVRLLFDNGGGVGAHELLLSSAYSVMNQDFYCQEFQRQQELLQSFPQLVSFPRLNSARSEERCL